MKQRCDGFLLPWAGWCPYADARGGQWTAVRRSCRGPYVDVDHRSLRIIVENRMQFIDHLETDAAVVAGPRSKRATTTSRRDRK
jgi:hypothetical protein